MKLFQVIKLRRGIVQGSESLPDDVALEVPELFPAWKPDHEYAVGDRLQYEHILYKVRQAHTSLANWPPDLTPALYEVVTVEDGTKDHPIHYNPGMALEEGKYYTESGVEYLCIRDTGVPVYNSLADLVGIYVEVAA